MITRGMRPSESKPPPPLTGLDRRRAILRQKHEREMQRLEPGVMRQCTQAERRLESDVATERQVAATTLGTIRDIESYKPLLLAMIRESEPGYEDRDVKVAILKALENIGEDHNSKSTLNAGREPLNRFMMAHLADAGLVERALNALKWTDSVEETSADASRIGNAAEAAGYPRSATAATSFYLDINNR